ncbi:MAG: acetyltransferase [Prevotella sp.]
MVKTYLFGASGHGKVIKDILNANGIKVEAFVDDNLQVNECAGRKVLHDTKGLSPMIVSIRVNNIRRIVVDRLVAKANADGLPLEFATAIHPSATASPSAKIGKGTVVMAGAVINADAVIGKHCIVNTGATVDHDCVIGDFCHIAPGANISGGTHIGEGTWIGVGACVIQCLTIGKDCMIGAGSVVVKDIPDGVIAYGNPCKVKTNIMQDNNMTNNNLAQLGGKIRICICFNNTLAAERRMSHAA